MSNIEGNPDNTLKSIQKPLSKWSQRRKLKPVTKTLSSSSDRNFFSLGGEGSDDEDRGEDEDDKNLNVKVNSDQIEGAQDKIDRAVKKEHRREEIKEVKSEVENKSKVESTDRINPSEDNVKSEKSQVITSAVEEASVKTTSIENHGPPLKRLRQASNIEVISLDSSDNEQATSIYSTNPPIPSVITPSPPPLLSSRSLDEELEALRELREQKIRNKMFRQRRTHFSVNVHISCSLVYLGEKSNTIISMSSGDEFSVLKQQYISYCIQNRMLCFSEDDIRTMVGSTILVYNDTLLSEDAVTPYTLGITPDNPNINIVIMTRDDFDELQNQSILNKEEDEFILPNDGPETVEIEEEEEAFTICLKDRDNSEFRVNVHSTTKIEKLIQFYRSKKGLDDNVKIRLEFDDDELDIKGIVGDTELEQDFTVDVYTVSS